MKKAGVFPVKVGVAALMCMLILIMAGCATLNPIENLLGKYEGTYTADNAAQEGEVGLILNIYREGFYYYAVFNFYPLLGITNVESGSFERGSYYMSMYYDRASNQWELKGTQWIEKSRADYEFVDLLGVLDGNVFRGSTYLRGSRLGTFRVERP